MKKLPFQVITWHFLFFINPKQCQVMSHVMAIMKFRNTKAPLNQLRFLCAAVSPFLSIFQFKTTDFIIELSWRYSVKSLRTKNKADSKQFMCLAYSSKYSNELNNIVYFGVERQYFHLYLSILLEKNCTQTRISIDM